ncbi:MAG: nodulation protein NfeD [Leptospirales bacterium]|nr:nodulation protein NfeD [Leptospirales bacterium]
MSLHRLRSRSARHLAIGALLALTVFGSKSPALAAPDAAPFAYRLQLSGPITPAAAETLQYALQRAEEDGALALILRLDTPGGLVSSMDEMVRAIMSSKVPVISYVAPPGASCGSAGVFLMYASQVSAMAPGTNIGSATPVSTGGGGFGGEQQPEAGEDRIPETAGANDELNMKRKILHHAQAQIRSLAQYYGRNQRFAERSITHADNLTTEEAAAIGAIDLIAENEAQLLQRIEGRRVRMAAGYEDLRLQGAEIREISADFRNRILSILSHPQVAMILMMLGMLGLMAEVYYSPGAIFPGALGALCLVVGLYALQTLPVDYSGLALIALGILFFILEIKIVSYGLLSVAGLISISLGALMLFRSGDEFLGAGQSAILTIAIMGAAGMAAIAYLAARAQRAPRVSGSEQLIRESGEASTEINASSGQVFIHSELWQARSEGGPIPRGAKVSVVARNGLCLTVRQE